MTSCRWGCARGITSSVALLVALCAGGAWVTSYIHRIRGGYQITIWPVEYGSGKINAAILQGCLSFGRQVRCTGSSSSKDLQISLPGLFEFSDRITDGGFVVLTGRPPLFKEWDVNIDMAAVAAIALLYPALVSRRLRGVLKWAFLIASLACFANLFMNVMHLSSAFTEFSQEDSQERLGRLLLFSILGSILFLRALKDSRQPHNDCQVCGYNLTGNVSGICPECGKPIEKENLTRGGIR